MGNYVFTTEALLEAVRDDALRRDQQARPGRQHHPDAGRGAARPRSTTSPTTTCPGATDRDRGYWRDVGTLDAYYDAHMDLIVVHPVFNLYNRRAGRSSPATTPLPPAKFVHDDGDRAGRAIDSLVSPGVSSPAAPSVRSILSPKVVLHSHSLVEVSTRC